MPMRRRSAGSVWFLSLTTRLDSKICPPVTGSRPATARSKVVLPQPEGPINTPMSPERRPRLTPRTAGAVLPGY